MTNTRATTARLLPAQATPRGGPQGFKPFLRVWWNEVDRVVIALVLALMLIGALAVAAASPVSAARRGLPEMYYLWPHLLWLAIGLGVMFITALMALQWLRRGAVLLGVLMLGALFLVPFVGVEGGAAYRWLNVFGMSLQPSEFLKPAFAVSIAWMLSFKQQEPGLPMFAVTGGLTGLILALLMAQPNLGEALLFAGAWFVVVLLAGLPLRAAGILLAIGVVVGLPLIYLSYGNGQNRINSFLGEGSRFDQEGMAFATLTNGGWTGTGLWMGREKNGLPEAHTDYIFSVIGEEFGLFVCAVLVVIYFAIVARVMMRLVEDDRLFSLLAGSGLAALFGAQAFINIFVNLQLAPSKGMTLPLISYGGSSTIAQCFTLGLLLAITRRNPYLTRDPVEFRGLLEKEPIA